jgi:GT2 family glycosyltransferase
MVLSAGFVILNYNDYESVKSLVTSMRNKGINDKVCIVDNCSTDDSFEKLCMLQSDSIDVIASGRNGGYAFGNNVGCRYLKEHYGVDIIFIANPDTEFDAETIEALKDAFIKYPQYAILSATMHDTNGNVSDRSYIYLPSFMQNLLLCFYIYNRIYRLLYSCKINCDSEVMDIDAAQGSFFAIRVDVLEKIGYFDEGTFLFYEEMCLAMKIREYNGNLKIGMLINQSYVHHHSVIIKNSMSAMKTYKIYLNSKMYFEKTYHHIGKIRQTLLKWAIHISCIEEYIRLELVHEVKNGGH